MKSYELSKQTSLILKGVAIILMVATHLLGASNDYLISIPIGGASSHLFSIIC